jgi:hypothetical protein
MAAFPVGESQRKWRFSHQKLLAYVTEQADDDK